MRQRSLEYVGAVTITGTVASVAADGGSFAVEGQNGTSRAFAWRQYLGNILDWLQVGDQIQELLHGRGRGADRSLRDRHRTAVPAPRRAARAATVYLAQLSRQPRPTGLAPTRGGPGLV